MCWMTSVPVGRVWIDAAAKRSVDAVGMESATKRVVVIVRRVTMVTPVKRVEKDFPSWTKRRRTITKRLVRRKES